MDTSTRDDARRLRLRGHSYDSIAAALVAERGVTAQEVGSMLEDLRRELESTPALSAGEARARLEALYEMAATNAESRNALEIHRERMRIDGVMAAEEQAPSEPAQRRDAAPPQDPGAALAAKLRVVK